MYIFFSLCQVFTSYITFKISMHILKNMKETKILNNSMASPLGSLLWFSQCVSAQCFHNVLQVPFCQQQLSPCTAKPLLPVAPPPRACKFLAAGTMWNLSSHTATLQRVAQHMNESISWRIRTRKTQHREKAQTRFTWGNVGRASSKYLLGSPREQQQQNL